MFTFFRFLACSTIAVTCLRVSSIGCMPGILESTMARSRAGRFDLEAIAMFRLRKDGPAVLSP